MSTPQKSSWPNGARAAISLTLDNMGEAADLNRNLWPKDEPIGSHYTVTTTIPQILTLLQEYDIKITYFTESWNINVYGDFILEKLVAAGHEIGWHAWQHEAWSKLTDESVERANFERSFGDEGVGKWVKEGKIEEHSGFRPPGGLIHGQRTLRMASEFGLKYISPAAEEAAVVPVGDSEKTMTILPFRWAMVDAYYYMETFAGLRKMKGEYAEEVQSPDVLVERYIKEIDQVVERGTFLSILFHPFLSNKPERVEAIERVLQHLMKLREEGKIWIARCKDVQREIAEHPNLVGSDPQWDLSAWR